MTNKDQRNSRKKEKRPNPSREDVISKTTKKGAIELNEEELAKATGGITNAWPKKYSGC